MWSYILIYCTICHKSYFIQDVNVCECCQTQVNQSRLNRISLKQ